MKNKKRVVVILLIFMILPFCFWRQIYCTSMGWYLKSYAKSAYSGTLNFSHTTWEKDKGIVFHQLKCEFPYQSSLTINQLAIYPNIFLFKRKIEVQVSIENSHLELSRGEFTRVIHHLQQEKPLYRGLPLHMQFDQMRISFEKENYQINGSWSLSAKPPAKKNRVIIASGSGSIQLEELSQRYFTKIKEISGRSIFHVYRSYQEEAFSEHSIFWSLDEGILNGEVSFSSLRDIEGDILIKGGIWDHPNWGVNVKGGKTLVALGEDREVNITLKDPASCTFRDFEGVPFWELQQIRGTINLDSFSQMEVELGGKSQGKDETAFFQLIGEADLQQFRVNNSDFQCHLFGGEHERESKTQISYQVIKEQERLELKVSDYSPKEIRLVQNFMKARLQLPEAIHCIDGNIYGDAIAYYANGELTSLDLPNFTVSHGIFKMPQADLHININSLTGKGKIDLKDTHLSYFQQFEGDVQLTGCSAHFNKVQNQRAQIENIDLSLSVEKGTMHKSLLRGEVLGVSFSCIWDPDNPYQLGSLECQVKAGEWESYYVDWFPQRFVDFLTESTLTFYTDLNLLDDQKGLSVDAHVRTMHKITQQENFISFGCKLFWRDFILKDPTFWSVPKKWEETLGEVLQIFDIDLKGHAIQVAQGYITSQDFPLEYFITPFIFRKPNHTATLLGYANLTGEFNAERMTLDYKVKNLVLDHPHMRIKVPKATQAQHTVDWKQWKQYGTLKLEESECYLVKQDLLFSGLKGEIVFDHQKIRGENLFSQSCEVSFEGEVEYDYGNSESDDVLIRTHNIYGKAQDVLQFCSHFEDSLLTHTPLQGEVFSVGDENKLYLKFEGASLKEISGEVSGRIKDGNYQVEDLALTDLTADFHGDFKNATLVWDRISGEIKRNNKSYKVVSNKPQLGDLREKNQIFDLSFYEADQEIIRIAGIFESTQNEEVLLQMNFDSSLTHIGGLSPNIHSCVFSGKGNLKYLRAEPVYQLSNLQKDWRMFHPILGVQSQDKLFSLLEKKELKGELGGVLEYDPWDQSFHFTASVKQFSYGEMYYDFMSYRGKFFDRQLSIESAQADAWVLSTNLRMLDSGYFIDFLGLQKGNELVLGIEGKYSWDLGVFEGNLNLLEVDLSHLSGLGLSGRLKAEGFFACTLSLDQPFFQRADWKASVQNFEYRDVQFSEGEHPFSLKYSLEEGLSINTLSGVITHLENNPVDLPIQISRIWIDPLSNKWEMQGLEFQLAEGQRKNVIQWLKPSWEHTESLEDFLEEIRPQSPIGGVLSIGGEKEISRLTFQFDDATYTMMGYSKVLNSPTFSFNGDQLRFLAFVDQEKYPFWIEVNTQFSDLSKGVIWLQESAYRKEVKEGIRCNLSRDLKGEWSLLSAQGTFLGINLDVKNSGIQKWDFMGEASFDFKEAIEFLPDRLQGVLKELTLGEGYKMQGKFHMDPTHLEEGYFQGKLIGEDFLIKNYRFQRITADLELSSEQAILENIYIKDFAGELFAPGMKLWKENSVWNFLVPQLIAKEITPSLLSTSSFQGKLMKSLALQEFQLQNLSGQFLDRSSWRGKGSLKFINPSKQGQKNTIWSFPDHLLSRLGLNLEMLTPVVGEVDYELKEGRLYLGELKETYSKGKMSSFYLDDRKGLSYVDLNNGKMNLRIRMKQHNLLLKFTELLTVIVKGTVLDPIYTVKKQNENQQVAEE